MTSEKLPRSRQEQRLLTRALICCSARTLFQSRGVDNVSVEQIASKASVTRSTFYLHFKGKEDVLRDVLQEVMQEQLRDYEKLIEQPRLDYAVIRRWLDEYHAAFVERSKTIPLFRDLARLNPQTDQGIILMHRMHTLAMLGTRFRPLNLSGRGQASERERAWAHMFLFKLEGVVSYFSTTEGAPDAAVGLDLIAEELTAMLDAENWPDRSF